MPSALAAAVPSALAGDSEPESQPPGAYPAGNAIVHTHMRVALPLNTNTSPLARITNLTAAAETVYARHSADGGVTISATVDVPGAPPPLLLLLLLAS